MSALGQKQTCAAQLAISGLGQKRTSIYSMTASFRLDDFPDLIDAVAFRHNHAGAVFQLALQHKLRLAV
jgi:hypothetical protein